MISFRLFVLALLVGFAGSAAHADAPAPRAVVEKFHVSLLEAMQKAKTLGYQGRYGLLKPAVDVTFDLPAMAEVAGGPPWRNLTDEQKKQFVDVFKRYTYATYASRFDGYDGERFETTGEQPGRNSTVLVNTQLVRPKDEPIALNYLVHQTEEGPRVIDVFLKGAFSELASKRSEYVAVIQRDGFPALISRLEAKIADYANARK
ncbi:MAG TPA: ABC transporter substrate-binding protein [Alphaproteobacteria bacterium]